MLWIFRNFSEFEWLFNRQLHFTIYRRTWFTLRKFSLVWGSQITLFSRYLNSANASFSVFHDFISRMANLKSSCDSPMLSSQMPYNIYSFGQYFEGFNFTNLSNPRDLWNLSTSKKQLYGVLCLVHFNLHPQSMIALVMVIKLVS